MYARTTKQFGKSERTVVLPGSYQELPKHYSIKGIILGDEQEGKATPVSVLGLFTSIPKGMNHAASLIFFIFIIGAVLNLIQHTGTIDVFMNTLLLKFENSPILLSFLIFLTVSLGATLLGLGAILIPLIPLFLMISKKIGFDRIYGVSFLVIANMVGWSTAITNPFTVQIAQQIAEVPIGSGMWLRVIFFVVCFAIAFSYLVYYGKKVKKDRSRSIMPDDLFLVEEDKTFQNQKITRKHFWIGISSFMLFGLILYAVQTMGWGLVEMTGGFFTVGLVTILISGMSGNESMKAFIKGLEVMIVPAIIVGFARGIQVVMEDGMIIDTILFHTADFLQDQNKLVAVEGMYLFQSMMNFFIPSASGQALVSMPLMVPLSDLLGITRQTAVLAFTSGDGFSNIIIPTNGVLMAILGIAGVPYEKWVKFIWPLFVMMAIVAGIFLFVAMRMNY
jgi:uncharacterized ion transporter superfamily protein YfcC